MLRFLTPYHGERYHLYDYEGRNRQPRGPKGLLCHNRAPIKWRQSGMTLLDECGWTIGKGDSYLPCVIYY